jgi:tetratricopeptide (TPR) repeat protein
MPSLSSIRGDASRRSRGVPAHCSRYVLPCLAAALAAAAFASPLAGQASDPAARLKADAALDLEGKYDAARADLMKLIDGASTDTAKVRPRRMLAVSYAFTCDVNDAAKVEHQIIDPALAAHDFNTAADVDNELARILLECGDVSRALDTYRAGHDAALQIPNLPDSGHDLWNFRWEHAQARVAARRGQRDEAAQHIAAAKGILDKGKIPDQARFFPYLTGYVALYAGDPKTAISDLQQADQKDPFILSLLAQAYEKAGDKAQAMMYYRKVLAIDTHNPPNAFAHPLALKKLASG